MASLRLTIHGVNCYADSSLKNLGNRDLNVSTEKETDTIFVKVSETEVLDYTLNLVDLSFKKKMYQPTEIMAEIQLTRANNVGWRSIGKDVLINLFLKKKVSLKETVVNHSIGSDFYVQEVKPRYKTDSLFVKLMIYSPDNLLALQHHSRSFVAKKLIGNILTDEFAQKEIDDPDNEGAKKNVYTYPLPYDNSKTIELNSSGAKQLFYTKGNDKCEHIFPYLVQYNESFYDFLSRTTNRWGEFLYYENGKLNIGYDTTKVKTVDKNYDNITYVNLDNESKDVPKDAQYDYAASEEGKFIDDTLRKSPNSVSGTLFWPTVKKWDKVLMKEITAFLKNDKNIPTWIGNRLFDNTWDVAVKAATVSKDNNEFNDTYFPSDNKPGLDVQYGKHNFAKKGEDDDYDDGFNQFSELDSTYKSSKYEGILKKEYVAARDAVNIDYGVTCPQLNLGDVIKVHDQQFIVVEISSHIQETIDYELNSTTNSSTNSSTNSTTKTLNKVTKRSLVFDVVATPKDKTEANKLVFYPVVIPAGHVRMSDPQIAVITDANDPSGNNRVRVMFDTWQTIHYEDETKKEGITDDTKKLSSPWLTFTTGSAGSPTIGKHYEKDKVLVGFIDGNIERPYVMGGLTSKGDQADFIQTTPGGHQLKLQDDEDGIKNFLTGMFLPCVDTLGPFLTAIPAVKSITDAICKPAQGAKNNLAMGGGFELSDNYGIYKVTGSTDGREISIASPWGDVNINAFTGITISAPNGDIEIKGKNIKLEAGNNLEIISGTNIKNKILGEGGKSGFFEDVGVAVAKKLAAKALNVVDLSIIRSVMEIIFRPAEGQLRIKSNRFLMLDAGKGDCVYPENAYVKKEDYEEYLKDQDKNNTRNGLRLSTNILEMLSRVNTLGDLMDSRYITSYNNCRQKYLAFNDSISKAQRYAKDYSPTNQHPKICNEYSEDALKNSMWADPATAPNFDKTKLGFVDAQYSTTDKASVGNAVIQRIKRKYPINAAPADDKIKEAVLGVRVKKIEQVVNAANELRQSIIDFLKFTELDPKKDIKATASAFRDRKMPKNFMEALLKAFQKSELGDTYYFLSIDDDKRKGLKAFATDLTRDIMAPHRQILKRKAGILLLEGMGFKDEWRKKKVVAAAPTTAQVMPVGGAAAVTVPLAPPIAPAAPPAPDLEVKREFDSEKLTQAYWTDYVNSIVTIPELKPDEWKLTKELGKMVDATKDNLKSIILSDIANENKAWSENKKGTILFSTGAKMFNLDKEIKELPAPPKGNLTEADSINDDVKGLLGDIREKLNGFN